MILASAFYFPIIGNMDYQRLYYVKPIQNGKIKLPLVGIEPWQPDSKSNIRLSTLTWHLPIKTELLGYLYSHALLMLL